MESQSRTKNNPLSLRWLTAEKSKRFDAEYWESLRIRTSKILVEAVDKENRRRFINEKGRLSFDETNHFLAMIIQLAIDGEIIVPASVNLDWDRNHDTMISFVREIVKYYSIPD